MYDNDARQRQVEHSKSPGLVPGFLHWGDGYEATVAAAATRFVQPSQNGEFMICMDAANP